MGCNTADEDEDEDDEGDDLMSLLRKKRGCKQHETKHHAKAKHDKPNGNTATPSTPQPGRNRCIHTYVYMYICI